MKLNPTIDEIRESATLAINMRVKALRQQGRKIYHFGFGQSPFPVHPGIQKALCDNAHRSEYLPTLGLPALRDAICRFLGKHFRYDFKPGSVIVGPGSKELIFEALYLLEGPLIIPVPSWVSYEPQARILSKPVIPIVTKKDNGYKLQAEELSGIQGKLPPGQSILILNSPNNPTGTVYSPAELESLARACRELNIIVISDEIYAHVCFDQTPAGGIGLYYPEGTLVTSGLSKGFSAGGYRLGFLAVPAKMKGLVRAFATLASETFSCVSAPVQHAAVAAYSDNSDIMEYVGRCTRIHHAAGNYLYERFTDTGLGCVRPQGGFYLFPDFAHFGNQLQKLGIKGSPDLCLRLLEDAGVALLPGTDFGHPADCMTCRAATVDYDGGAVLDASAQSPQLDRKFIEKHCPNLKDGCDAIREFLDV